MSNAPSIQDQLLTLCDKHNVRANWGEFYEIVLSAQDLQIAHDKARMAKELAAITSERDALRVEVQNMREVAH